MYFNVADTSKQPSILSIKFSITLGIKAAEKISNPEFFSIVKNTSVPEPTTPPNRYIEIGVPTSGHRIERNIPVNKAVLKLKLNFLEISPTANPTIILTKKKGIVLGLPDNIGANIFETAPTVAPLIGPNEAAIKIVPIVSKKTY